MKKKRGDVINFPVIGPRPLPPAEMFEAEIGCKAFIPAHGVAEWALKNIISDTAPLHNPEHLHLLYADIAFLWAGVPNSKKGRTIIGQAEEVMFRSGAWQTKRQEQQMREWFDHVPAYLITLDAVYAYSCSDVEWCALLEHELYHIGHKLDDYGVPAFTKEGTPKLAMRGHDVEEFVGVVRRYGASAEVQKMIDAAKTAPEVSKINIARACGTCLLRLA